MHLLKILWSFGKETGPQHDRPFTILRSSLKWYFYIHPLFYTSAIVSLFIYVKDVYVFWLYYSFLS